MFLRLFSRFAATAALAAGIAALTVSELPVLADNPPDAPIAAPSQTFVGDVKNAVDTARVGLVADPSSFVFYLCSQDEAFNKTSARWVRGVVANGKFEGKSPDGALTVRGTIGNETAEGTIAVGSNEMTFAAKRPDERTYAGLYRCEEKEAANDYVAGWVVDEDDAVAGAIQNRQNKQITNPPGVAAQQKPNPKGNVVSPRAGGGLGSGQGGGGGIPPRGGNRIPNLDVGQGTGVGGQQVTDPKKLATGAGKKFTEEDAIAQAEEIGTSLEKKGGSPLLAMTIHQVRRFNKGAKPSGPLEAKTFARLARIPAGSLAKYEKNWDKLPATVRTKILGPVNSQLTPNTPLTAQNARQFAAIGQPVPADVAANAPKVSSVRFTQFTCVNPADVAKDEIFFTALVASGTTGFSNVSSTYKDIKKGNTRNFNARDSQFWPAANATAQTANEMAIGVGVFDDDSRVRGAVVSLMRGLADVAGDIASTFDGGAIGGVAGGFQNFLEGAAAAIDTARFIGSDTLVVRPNKQSVSTNGQPKTELRFLRSGNNTVDYRFKGLIIN